MVTVMEEMTGQETQQCEETENEVMEMEEKFSFPDFCEEAVSLLLMAYMFILFCLYPFYLQNGYHGVGTGKYNFYRDITIGGFALIGPLAILCAVFRFKGKKKTALFKSLSFTDCAFALYGAGVLLSFFYTEFKQEAFWGERGWHMGLVTQLLFILSYFLVSRFWEYEEKILLAFMAAASMVFLLGLLNRFSVYPIEIKGASREFISTLGNINWYSGYWAVLFPIGFVLYWFTDKPWLRAPAALYTLLGIATGVSQGSNSVFIVFAGLYIVIFCLSFKSLARMKRFFELCFMFCASCQGLRLWRLLLPENFDYYDGSLCDWITMTRLTLFAMVPVAAIYILLVLAGRKKYMDITKYKMIRQIVILLIVLIGGVYIMLLILNSSMRDGIRFLGNQSALIFSEFWGSSRGGTWSAGINTFRHMPASMKLVGAGPDCFAMYLYTVPDVMEAVVDQFGTSRLTNAHNEWLTVLVNNGIIGFTGYALLFSSAFIRFINRAQKVTDNIKKEDKGSDAGLFLYLFAISAFCYSIHNIVSFQQILSTPLVFVLLGMGERLMRETS